jgi:hypothetical protein
MWLLIEQKTRKVVHRMLFYRDKRLDTASCLHYSLL